MQTSFLALVVLTCACSLVLGQDKNIAELAQNDGDLSTLVTALKAGNLVTALQGAGPFTVFAPSNEAFAKIPKTELDKLLQPNNVDQLVGILKYHVLSGAAVQSKDLQSTQEIKTLEGNNVLVQSVSTDQIVNDIHAAINAGVPLWCEHLMR